MGIGTSRMRSYDTVDHKPIDRYQKKAIENQRNEQLFNDWIGKIPSGAVVKGFFPDSLTLDDKTAINVHRLYNAHQKEVLLEFQKLRKDPVWKNCAIRRLCEQAIANVATNVRKSAFDQ